MKHKLLAVFLALVMTLSLLPTAALAEEETSDAVALRALFNEALKVGGNGIVELDKDYDLSSGSWEPLYVRGNLTINGNNHTISNLKVDGFTQEGWSSTPSDPTSGHEATYYTGFIGDIKTGCKVTVNNVNFDSALVDNQHLRPGSTGSSILAVVVANNNGTLVYNDVNVLNSTVKGYGKTGLLHGFTQHGSFVANHCSVANSHVVVEADGTDSEAGFGAILIGYDGSHLAKTNGIKMTDCDITVDSSVNWPTGTYHTKADGTYYVHAYNTNWGITSPTYTHGSSATNSVAFAAEVDGYKYETLVAAINAAKSGDTVTLRQNVTENVTIPAGTTLTLDLNGCTLSGGTDKVDDVATAHKDKPAILNEGTLTIKDSKGTGVVKRDDVRVGGDSYYVIDNQGTMTIESGNYFNDSGVDGSGSSLIRNAGKSKAATLNIRGGTFQQDNFIAIKNDDYGILNITGGEINSANESAVQNWAQANITGGTVNGLIWTSVWSETFDASKTIISDNAVVNGTIRADKYAPSLAKTPVTEISGGTFAVNFDIRDNAYPTITGGTFSSKPAYVASGYHAVEDGSSYTVHAFEVTSHADKAPTCTEPGNIAYFTCSGCGAGVYYSDESCTKKLDKVAIDALGHSYSDAWTTNPDKHWHECSVCHAVKDEAAHTFEKSGIVGGEYEWTCSVCGYSKTGAADAHAVDTSKVTNGTVVAEPNPATVGQSVKLTLTPKDGYSDTDVQLYYSYADVVNAELSGLTFTMPDAAVTITGAFKPVIYTITYNLDGGTNSTANPSTYTVEKGFSLTAPTKSGYTFLGWSFDNNSNIIKEVTVKDGSTGPITFTAHWSYNGGGSTGGGGGSTGGSTTSTTTEKNPDGSTTTTTTNKTTGTVTETTKNTDGSTTTVETKKDGTVTETVKTTDGTTGTVVTDKNGDVTEAKATVSTTAAKEAAKTGEAVTLPVEVPAVKTTEEAPAMQVTVPKSAGSVKVEIPVEKVTPGTVAVIVNADGTEKIVSTSMVTENGVTLNLDGNATVKIIDNSKTFSDVPESNVFYNEISSLSAREIMVGKTDDKFDLHNSVTLNQIANVAGRITGDVDVKDFNAGVSWGNDKGLKTGNEPATRGDVLKALYIAAGSPAVEDTSVLNRFNDAASIPADMAAIAAWAAQNGILKGGLDGNANLGVNVTRGQACALAGRTMGTLA